MSDAYSNLIGLALVLLVWGVLGGIVAFIVGRMIEISRGEHD